MTLVNKSELFKLANHLRKENNLSQKEAFAVAKAQLNNVSANELIKAMKRGNVKFTFLNRRGKAITTTGTLNFDKVPTNRKVEGSKQSKNTNMCVFYDVRHGVYRQFDKTKVMEIISKYPKK